MAANINATECNTLPVLYNITSSTVYYGNILLLLWQQIVTGAAQPGAGLLDTGIVQKPLGMRVLRWHKRYENH